MLFILFPNVVYFFKLIIVEVNFTYNFYNTLILIFLCFKHDV